METIPEGFEKILIGNIRGLTGTIEPGTITLTAPGTEPSVTNSGTDTEAVFNFKLPRIEVSPRAIYDEAVADGFAGTFDDWQREYLGGLISPDLPWCEGYFQDRSTIANSWAELTPICEGGDSSLVSGSRFITATAGIYLLVIFGGQTITSGRVGSIIRWGNMVDETTQRHSINYIRDEINFPSNTVLTRMSESDYLQALYFTHIVQSTVDNNALRKPRFSFIQLTQEAV